MIVLLAMPIYGQQMQRPRVVPPPQPVVRAESVGVEDALKENITIRLQGTAATGAEVDLSLTGIGPRFAADQMIGGDAVLTCDYVVAQAEGEGGYLVSYSVGVRVKVATHTNASQGTTSFEFRDVTITGTVLCRLDEAVAIVRNGDKPLQLTVSKAAGRQDG